MSNIKFYTNRQVALQMAIEARKAKYKGALLEVADEFYEWLQDAPMKDQDKDDRFWYDGPIKTKIDGKDK
jgi:dsDNA-binding SOS-regulon protein